MKRRGGFAMVMAIMCISLMAIVLAVAAVYAAGESRRTMLAAEDAQLRQLLVAGMEIAGTNLPLTGRVDVDLPAELKERGAMLSLSPVDGSGGTTVVIEAGLPKHRVSQVVRFSQENGKWAAVDATGG